MLHLGTDTYTPQGVVRRRSCRRRRRCRRRTRRPRRGHSERQKKIRPTTQ